MFKLKVYVSDAVAFLYFLLDKLPRKANEAFKEAERGKSIIYLPTIAAAELYYLFEKKKWLKLWKELKSKMQEAEAFRFYPFNEKVLDYFSHTKAKEIHDKIIISTAKVLKAYAVITKDKDIAKLKEVDVIWS